MAQCGKDIGVVPGGAAAGVVVVGRVEVDVVLGVEVAESTAQFLHDTDAVRLEQAGQVGVDEHHPCARRGVGDDVRPCPDPLQEPCCHLTEIGVAHHPLAGNGTGEVAFSHTDEVPG